MVAVKVIEYAQQDNQDGCLLEGLLSEQVQHPHVVRTYKHVTRPLRMNMPGGFVDEEEEDQDVLGSCSTDGLPNERTQQLMETWCVAAAGCSAWRGGLSAAVQLLARVQGCPLPTVVLTTGCMGVFSSTQCS